MNATSRPLPGSPAAVLDSVVRAVTEGRYRMAQLQLQWHSERAPLPEMAELVTAATEIPMTPSGIAADSVIASIRAVLLPDWLAHHIENEVRRIFAGQPVAGAAPVQLVARVAAAMAIDVAVETDDAAHRATHPEVGPGSDVHNDDAAVRDIRAEGVPGEGDEGVDAQSAPAARRKSLIHLGLPDTIDLDQPQHASNEPLLPPPPR